MIKKNKLVDARKSKDYTQDNLADKLKINVSSYSRKENGNVKISFREWEKLSELLEVPLEDIYESEENMIFLLNDNSTGNGNIVTNYVMPQSIWETQKKYIEKLEEEIQVLKEEINLLRNK